MELTKKVNLEGNNSVRAYVYRNGQQITFKCFDYIFTACLLPWREAKALEECYAKANKWADEIIAVEQRSTHS